MLRFLTRRRLFWVFFLSSAGVAAALLSAPFGPPNDPFWDSEDGSTHVVCSPIPMSPLCGKPFGQWDLRSNKQDSTNPLPHASGISADLAWQVEVGRPDVVVAVLDSGVNYDQADLRNKIWLNCGELPAPNNAGTTTPAASPGCRDANLKYDINNDGVFSIEDYITDTRVTTRLSPLGANRISVSDVRQAFADGMDNDSDGFPDDISGWDADDNDGDEYDATRFGHGTGRNGFIAAETNNGVGIAGICPNCRLANVRVDDTFVHKSEGAGVGAIFAADHGFSVINMALGATSASTFTRAAFDYAYRHNVLALNASANEFSYHQNFQTIFDDVMGIGGVVPDNDFVGHGFPDELSPSPTTWLRKANFSNYGAHLDVVAPSDSRTTGLNGGFGDSSGTSSAVPHAAGVAALVYSRARNLINAAPGAPKKMDASALALKDISALEVKQIVRVTADDITQSDDSAQLAQYPSIGPGWDKYTGYGRINAQKAVNIVGPDTMPPEADIDSPDWYSYVDGTVNVKFYANARWAGSYSWTLEFGQGIQPSVFTPLGSGNAIGSDPGLSSANMVDNFTQAWDTTTLANGMYTLRLRVTDNKGNSDDDRMTVWVRHADAQDFSAAWPKRMGRMVQGRFYPVSLESISSALVDLDGDNRPEIIFTTADGEVHALHADGTEQTGFPVHGNRMPGLPLSPGNTNPQNFNCDNAAPSPAFRCVGNTGESEVPIAASSTLFGVSVGDIDGDGTQEICSGSYDGHLYCWKANGTLQPGFPVAGDPWSTFNAQNVETPTGKPEAIPGPGVFYDLDGDGKLEILSGGFDQKLYAWRSDGSRFANFPITLVDAAQRPNGINRVSPSGIISMPLVGDIDGDGKPEIVVGTTESYGSPAPPVVSQVTGGSGRAYALKGDANGNNWAVMSGWPVSPLSLQPCPVPLVACGVGHGVVGADLDGSGKLKLAMGIFLGGPYLFNSTGGSAALTFSSTPSSGGAPDDHNEETPEGGSGRLDDPAMAYVALGAFADVNNDGVPEYMTGTLGAQVATLAAGSGKLAPFDHYLGVWQTTGSNAGNALANFPRIMEDWQFFTGPAVADIDGPGTAPEIIEGSGGYFLHAFTGTTGSEPSGWPKTIGQWIVSTPAIGDLNDDGQLEVVAMTRLGTIHVYKTTGADCQPEKALWRKARHNEWNTGVLGKDTLRPDKVDNLSGAPSGNTVNLTWTAVGDDGRCGTAKTYDLRRSGSAITEANFKNAQAVPGVPAPHAAGTAEQFSIAQTGGDFLGLRVIDDAGNFSPVATAVITQLAASVASGGNALDHAAAAGSQVSAGTFTLHNGSGSSQSITQFTFTASHPEVQASLAVSGGGGTFSCTRLSTGFRCAANPAATVDPGATIVFTVQATIAAASTVAQLKTMGGFAALGGIAMLGMAGLRVRRRRLILLVQLLLTMAMLQGCFGNHSGNNSGNGGGGSGGSGGSPGPTPASSTTLSLTQITANSGQTSVTYGGLPISLGTVTRTP